MQKNPSIFSVYDSLSVKLLTSLRLQFSHLNEHKFRHSFGDTINAMYACRSEVETTEHFLLQCHLHPPHRLELFENLEKVDWSFSNLNIKDKVSFLLYGSQSATSKSSNHGILKFVINFIKETVLIDLFFVQTNDLLVCFCFFFVFFFWFRYVPIDSYQLNF